MSTKAQKIFAKYISTRNKQERDTFGRKLKQMHAKNKDLYYVTDGQKFTIHGNISFGECAKPKRGAASPRPQKSQRQKWGPYSSPPEPRRYAPPPPTEEPGPKVRYSNLRPNRTPKRKRREPTYWSAVAEGMKGMK